MTETIISLVDKSFTLFFAVVTLIFVFKYMPQLITAWQEFTHAIEKNTEITNQHYQETIDLKTQLLELKKRLEIHDSNAHVLHESQAEIRKNQAEIIQVLEEIKELVMRKGA